MADAPSEVRELLARVEGGDAPQVSVREVLRWYGAPRLTLTLRWQFREHLAAVGLVAAPGLDDVSLDSVITVRRDGHRGDAPLGPPPRRGTAPASHDLRSPSRTDLTIRLADVADCIDPAVTVAPEAPLSRAASLLATRGCEHVVVASGTRAVRGVITWERLGRAALTSERQGTVGAWTREVDVIDQRTPLVDAVAVVERDGVAVVTAADRSVLGVLGVGGACRAQRRIVTPFLLLDEIEQRLRARLADRPPNAPAFRTAGEPTFGDYLRAIEDPGVYERLGIGADRDVFRALVDQVRTIRNRCMHFAPEGIGPDDLRALSSLVGFLRDLR